MTLFIISLLSACQKTASIEAPIPSTEEKSASESFTVIGTEIPPEHFGAEYTLPELSSTIEDLQKDSAAGDTIRFEAQVQQICDERCDIIVAYNQTGVYLRLDFSATGRPINRSVLEYLCDIEGQIVIPDDTHQPPQPRTLRQYEAIVDAPLLRASTVSCVEWVSAQ